MKLAIIREYPNNLYDKLEGDNPFAKAVNKIMSEYWVSTGRERTIETVMIEVLADFYNEFYATKGETINS